MRRKIPKADEEDYPLREKMFPKAEQERTKRKKQQEKQFQKYLTNLLNKNCLLYTSPSPRDKRQSRMPSSA